MVIHRNLVKRPYKYVYPYGTSRSGILFSIFVQGEKVVPIPYR